MGALRALRQPPLSSTRLIQWGVLRQQAFRACQILPGRNHGKPCILLSIHQPLQHSAGLYVRLSPPPCLNRQLSLSAPRLSVSLLRLAQGSLTLKPCTLSEIQFLFSGHHLRALLYLSAPYLPYTLQPLQPLRFIRQTLHAGSMCIQIDLSRIKLAFKMTGSAHQPVVVHLSGVSSHHSGLVSVTGGCQPLSVHPHVTKPLIGFLPDEPLIRLHHPLGRHLRFFYLGFASR